MRKFAVCIWIVFLATNLCSQTDSTQGFLYIGPTDLSIGTVQGIHPNLNNIGFGNFINGDINQRFRVKGIPLQFVGHISNETLRIGKPSYFRLSYDENTFKKLDKSKLQVELSQKELELKQQLDSLHVLEGKLSFQREMLRRAQQQQGISIPTIPKLPNFPDSLKKPELDLPELPLNSPIEINQKQRQFDSILLSIQTISGNISDVKGSIDSLKINVEDLKGMHLSSYVPPQFKLKKANIGLTSLSSGGLSNNTIPIHGIHVEGTYRRSFYDVSAGLTQPFQNFSAQVFDQITNNTQNVFNLNDFYNVNRMKFISSEIIGLGDRHKTHLKLEHYYSGRSWESIKNSLSEPITNTLNLSGSADLKRIKNLKVGFLVGLSIKSRDSISTEIGAENIAYRGTANYKIEQTNGELQSEIRSLGGNYDGITQGLFINGTRHIMLGYLQKLGRHSSIATRFMEDRFSNTDSVVLFNQSRRWMTQFNSPFNRYNTFQLSYSLIQGSGNEIKNRKGHLGTAMFINEIQVHKNRIVNILQGGYTFIPIRIGNQEIAQASITSDFHARQFTYGVKGSYEKYTGLTQLWGENYILEPHVGFRGKKGEVFFSYQYLKSQQFSVDNGLTFRVSFSPSQFITWQASGQKWLAKDRNFFLIQAPGYVAPWYVDFKIIIHLNVQK